MTDHNRMPVPRQSHTTVVIPAIEPPLVCCPICNASGAALRHDVRAALVYSCEVCLHEWETVPGEELPASKSAIADRG